MGVIADYLFLRTRDIPLNAEYEQYAKQRDTATTTGTTTKKPKKKKAPAKKKKKNEVAASEPTEEHPPPTPELPLRLHDNDEERLQMCQQQLQVSRHYRAKFEGILNRTYNGVTHTCTHL